MYRVGCTMTAGSSGGGWIAAGQDGEPALVSNTSIGPVTTGWLAGPRLGEEAKGVTTRSATSSPASDPRARAGAAGAPRADAGTRAARP
ncbi:hypothetical protein STANM309S_04949 [Streptomyces tanashiensis]